MWTTSISPSLLTRYIVDNRDTRSFKLIPQRAMLTMGEMISDLFLGNKNLRKLIDKTLLKVALLLLIFFLETS